MKTSSGSSLVTAASVALLVLVGGMQGASALQGRAPRPSASPAVPIDPAQAGLDPLAVEPRVPRADGSPCNVALMSDLPIGKSYPDSTFNYTPPAGCAGPYAKIILVVELTGPRQQHEPASMMQLAFTRPNMPGMEVASVLFAGAPQITADIPIWHMERDVTEYAAVLAEPLQGSFWADWDNDYFDGDFLEPVVRSIRLLFQPGSATTPAQRHADVVLSMASGISWRSGGVVGLDSAFPRNIERAYFDVIAKPTYDRFWFACAPQQAWEAYPILYNGYAMGNKRIPYPETRQGCGGGSFGEVEVLIDGQLAGLAPVFPALASRFPGTVDEPAPSVQALNMVPYRVDLTPFAGLLNDGAIHTVEARVIGATGARSAFLSANLLLYLDRGRAIVPGAVTRNTLASQPAAPVETSTLVQAGEPSELTIYHLTGDAVTRAARSFRIEGYVETSRGRINSSVVQENRFENTLTYDVSSRVPEEWPYTDDEADFRQNVRLTSQVDSVARRTLGGTLLSEDRLTTTYPLVLDYHQSGADGQYRFEVEVLQTRGQRSSQVRRGTPTVYTTALADVFHGSHDYSSPVGGTPAHSNWSSVRRYKFTDNRSSCYAARLTTANGLLTSRTRGMGCYRGNKLRWFANPDGTFNAINWRPAP